MVIDQIEHLDRYKLKEKEFRLIGEFIDRVKRDDLPEGRYELYGEQLFALVQSYETKDQIDAKMETHKKYVDLQYMIKGEEQVYLSFADELAVTEDNTPAKDAVFYRVPEQTISTYLKEGMFLLLYPWDAHQPCCHPRSGRSAVRKIVFKIAWNAEERPGAYGNE